MNINEEKYLKGLINDICVFDCFLNGIYYITSNKDDKIGKLQDIDTWFNKISSLISKINFSLFLAIENENKIPDVKYNPFKNCENNDITYYYIENAMFRLSTLWDTLAQLVNIFYELDKLRNRIVHRNDPHSISIINRLDEAMGLPEPPLFELKRLIEDYSVANKFIIQIYDYISVYIKENAKTFDILK